MKFSDEYPYSCITVKKFSRFPVVYNEGNFFINDGRNSVVKVQDQKLLHSWTLEHPHSFTSAVAFCLEDESLYCISDNDTLLKWSVEDENLQSATKFQFQEAIFDILPLKKHRPIVLFTSGRIALTEYLYVSLEPIGEKIVAANEEIVWAEAVSIPSEFKIVCLTFSKDNKTHKLHCLSLKKRSISNHSSQVIQNAYLTLKNWCLDKNSASFISIWSDGSILLHHLHSNTQSLLVKIPCVSNNDQLDVYTINADHILILITNPNKKESVLEMWDTRFKSMKAKKVLNVVSTDNLQLYCINSSIFLLSNENLIEIHCIIGKSTLASSIGKSDQVTPQLQYCWKMSDCASVLENKSTDLNVKNLSHEEKMDIDGDETYQKELLAQRFINDGALRSNNRECELIDLLRFAARLKYKKDKSSIEPHALFKAVFMSSFRESALIPYIKQLSLDETLVTLETLLDLVDREVLLNAGDVPSDSQVFDWIVILIKSHTSTLLLSKDKKKNKLLRKLDHCLSYKMKIYEDLNQVGNIFHLLKKKDILPGKHISGKYFVESINI